MPFGRSSPRQRIHSVGDQQTTYEKIGQRGPVDLAKRDKKLRIDRLEQREVKSSRSYQFAKLLSVRHQECLDDRVDNPSCPKKNEELGLVPARCDSDRVRMMEDQNVEADIHQRPTNA